MGRCWAAAPPAPPRRGCLPPPLAPTGLPAVPQGIPGRRYRSPSTGCAVTPSPLPVQNPPGTRLTSHPPSPLHPSTLPRGPTVCSGHGGRQNRGLPGDRDHPLCSGDCLSPGSNGDPPPQLRGRGGLPGLGWESGRSGTRAAGLGQPRGDGDSRGASFLPPCAVAPVGEWGRTEPGASALGPGPAVMSPAGDGSRRGRGREVTGRPSSRI